MTRSYLARQKVILVVSASLIYCNFAVILFDLANAFRSRAEAASASDRKPRPIVEDVAWHGELVAHRETASVLI